MLPLPRLTRTASHIRCVPHTGRASEPHQGQTRLPRGSRASVSRRHSRRGRSVTLTVITVSPCTCSAVTQTGHTQALVHLSSPARSRTHKLVVPGSLMPAPTPQTPPQSPRVSPAGLSGTLSSLYHFLSSQAWQGAQEAISSLGNVQAGLRGSQGERTLPAHSLLPDPLHPVSSRRGRPSPAGSPRLAPHQEEGKIGARPWGQRGGHVLTSAPALTREAPATAPGLPRGRLQRPGSSRPPQGPPASAAPMWGEEGVPSKPPPQKAAVFRAITAPSSWARRYQHPSPPSSPS